MKLPITLIIALYILCPTTQQVDCALGARVYPLKYVGATQTVEFRIYLQSTCFDFPQMLYFILPYSKNYKLTQFNHPKKIILDIKKRVYEFNFSDSERKGYNKFFNIFYNSVSVQPSEFDGDVATNQNNLIHFFTSETDGFTKKNVREVLYKKNPIICAVINNGSVMTCKL